MTTYKEFVSLVGKNTVLQDPSRYKPKCQNTFDVCLTELHDVLVEPVSLVRHLKQCDTPEKCQDLYMVLMQLMAQHGGDITQYLDLYFFMSVYFDFACRIEEFSYNFPIWAAYQSALGEVLLLDGESKDDAEVIDDYINIICEQLRSCPYLPGICIPALKAHLLSLSSLRLIQVKTDKVLEELSCTPMNLASLAKSIHILPCCVIQDKAGTQKTKFILPTLSVYCEILKFMPNSNIRPAFRLGSCSTVRAIGLAEKGEVIFTMTHPLSKSNMICAHQDTIVGATNVALHDMFHGLQRAATQTKYYQVLTPINEWMHSLLAGCCNKATLKRMLAHFEMITRGRFPYEAFVYYLSSSGETRSCDLLGGLVCLRQDVERSQLGNRYYPKDALSEKLASATTVLHQMLGEAIGQLHGIIAQEKPTRRSARFTQILLPSPTVDAVQTNTEQLSMKCEMAQVRL